MHGFRGIITKFFSKRAQEIFLTVMTVGVSFLFISTWPHRFVILRQYFPREISVKWLISFASLNSLSNIQVVEHYNNLAETDIKEGNFNQALDEYNKATSINIAFADPYYNRGCLYIKLGNWDLAIKDFIKTIEINPKFVAAYDDLGFVYAKKGQLERSIALFSKAMSIDPRYAPAYYNQEMVYFLLKQYDKAWQDVHQAQGLGIKDNPDLMKMLKSVSEREK